MLLIHKLQASVARAARSLAMAESENLEEPCLFMAEPVQEFAEELGLVACEASPEQPLAEDVQEQASVSPKLEAMEPCYPPEAMDIMNRLLICRFCKRSSKDLMVLELSLVIEQVNSGA